MEKTRKLCDDILITKLGFGAWAIGGGAYGDIAQADAMKALDCYCSFGGNFIDTAQAYADSEEIIGKYLKETGKRKDLVIATKTASGGSKDSLAEIEPKLDISLKRLGTDYVDLYYFHSPAEDDETIEQGIYIMESLKKKGKIRAIGASIKGVDVTDDTVSLCKKYIDTKKIDAIQLVYSILRQKTDEVFDYAQKGNVALVGRTSLESGFLTGKYDKNYKFPESDHRTRWVKTYVEIMEYVEYLTKTYIGSADSELTSLALRFAMQPDAITNTIVGAKNETQMKQIIEYYNRGCLNDEVVNELKAKFKDKTHIFNTEN